MQDFVCSHAAAGHWPAATYAFGRCVARPAWCGAVGAGEDALFDLASVTKAVFTTVVACRLAWQGLLDLDAPLDSLLPEMRDYAAVTPSMRGLLAHQTGLPSWRPLYRFTADLDEIPALIASFAPETEPGTAPLYSCLGPILAAIVLERASGLSLRQLLERDVREPLGIPAGELCFGPLAEPLRAKAMPTETGRLREAELAESWPRERCPVAPGPVASIHGEVHDGNAFFLGGAAGNAGLFGTARAVFRVAAAVAAEDAFLPESFRRELEHPCARSPREVRTLGFQSGETPTAPVGSMGSKSYGHTGFTGTSVWLSPEHSIAAVLLTNRVHPLWTAAPMQSWRSAYHELVVANLL